MSDNLTFQQKLVEELPIDKGMPVGREGFDVVVIKRIGTGYQYYHTLGPGENLRITERIFGQFSAFIVDMRSNRMLEISGQFPTMNPIVRVQVDAKVLYRVTNSRTVAIEVEDPLARFRERILGALRRDIGYLPHTRLNDSACGRIILNVGAVTHLGLAVEGVDWVTLEFDSKVLKELEQRAELDHRRNLGREFEEDTYDRELRRRVHDLKLTQLQALTESELQQQIELNAEFRARLVQFIREQTGKDIEPSDMMRLIHEVNALSNTVGSRIQFGSLPGSSRIRFGQVIDTRVVPPAPLPPPYATPDDDDDDA